MNDKNTSSANCHIKLFKCYLLRKENNEWVKKCMEYEAEVPDQKVD